MTSLELFTPGDTRNEVSDSTSNEQESTNPVKGFMKAEVRKEEGIVLPETVVIARAPKVNSTLENGLELQIVPKTINTLLAEHYGKYLDCSARLSYCQLQPLKPTLDSVKSEFIEYRVPVQRIDFEWDDTSLEVQLKLMDKMASLIHTPSFAVFSGNKSYHYNMFFKHFANNAEEYEDHCFGLLAYFAEVLPDDFLYATNKNDVPKEKHHLLPDFSMWKGGSRWTRQAWGTNTKTGQRQRAKIYHNRHTELQDISNFCIKKEVI